MTGLTAEFNFDTPTFNSSESPCLIQMLLSKGFAVNAPSAFLLGGRWSSFVEYDVCPFKAHMGPVWVPDQQSMVVIWVIHSAVLVFDSKTLLCSIQGSVDCRTNERSSYEEYLLLSCLHMSINQFGGDPCI